MEIRGVGIYRRAVAAVVAALFWISSVQSTRAAENQNADLGSTVRSHVAPALTHEVPINVGGRMERVQAGQSLTAAESAALNQVLHTGRQNLVLSETGAAAGGVVDLRRDVSQQLSNLVIPQGVTAIRDFANSSLFQLSGQLTNGGNLFAFTSNSTFNTASITANTITNLQGAVLSSVRPQGVFGIPLSATALNLHLTAADHITNLGSILSSGSLALTAPSVVNGMPQNSSSGTASVLQAVGDVNIITNALVNASLISSSASNVRIQGLAPAGLSIFGTGGTIEAFKGKIEVLNELQQCNDKIRMIGGNYLARELNINAGAGALDGNVGEVNALVNITAGNSLFGASTPDLKFGNLVITGDPTYFNTQGSLVLNGLTSVGADLALIARGDVIVRSGAVSAPNITVIAGAEVSSSNGDSGSGDTSTTLTLNQSLLPTGGSPTGGAIDLSGAAVSTTGNLTMVAYGGSGAENGLTAGTINLGSSSPVRAQGQVLIIAGASGDPAGGAAVTLPALGRVDAQPQSISIYTAKPVLNSVAITNGTVTGGSISADIELLPASVSIASGPPTLVQGSMVSASIIQGNSSLLISAGKNIAVPGQIFSNVGLGSTLGKPGSVNLQAGGNILVGPIEADGRGTVPGTNTGISGGSILLQSGGDIQVNGYLSADGGMSKFIRGNGGNISISAADKFSISGMVSASGALGGTINVTGSEIEVNGTSDNVSLRAFGTGGQVSLNLINGLPDKTLRSNMDLSDENHTIPLTFVRWLTVGSKSGESYLAGTIEAGDQPGAIKIGGFDFGSVINGTTQVTTLNSLVPTPGSIVLKRDGVEYTYTAGTMLTPAEAAAIAEISTRGSTALELGGNGVAVGGVLTITDVNLLDFKGLQASFQKLMIPSNVRVVDESSGQLGFINSARIDGTLDFTNVGTAGIKYFRAPSLTVNGSVNLKTAGNLHIEGNINYSPVFQLALGADGAINTIAGNISFNSQQHGSVVVTSSGTGSINALGLNSQVIFNGGTFSLATTRQVVVNVGSIVGIVSGSGSSFDVMAQTGGLSVGSVITTDGAVSLTAGSGQLHVVPDSRITAIKGPITLRASDGVNGSIFIDDNVTLRGLGTQINVVTGTQSGSQNFGEAPAGLTVKTQGANVYFGNTGVSVLDASSRVTAIGANVVFGSLSEGPAPITLGKSVHINTGPGAVINSLNLADGVVAESLLNLQMSNQLGGRLILGNINQAVGGSLIISDNDVLVNLATNVVVPSSVVLQFVGFQKNNPIKTAAGMGDAIVNIFGSMEFVSASDVPSNPFFDIGGTNSAMVVSGRLISDGSVNITIGGGVMVNGLLSAKGDITLNSVSPTPMLYAGIVVSGNIYAGGSKSTISLSSTSSIVHLNNGVVSGDSVVITSSGAPTGTPPGPSPLVVATNKLSVTADSLSLTALGSVELVHVSGLNGANAQSFSLRNNAGVILVGSDIFANNTYLTTDSGTVIFSGTPTVHGSIQVSAENGAVFAVENAHVAVQTDLSILTQTLVNPSGFAVGRNNLLYLYPSSSNRPAVLANPFGDLVLTPNMTVYTGGNNLQIFAQGNISALGVPAINTTGVNGSGSVFIVAGIDTAIIDVSLIRSNDPRPFTVVTGPSMQGGSVDLGYTSITTSNLTLKPNDGQSITIVAHEGSANAGTIRIGALSTNSLGGKGGSITLLAPGGVVVNGMINTQGVLGGGAVLIGAGGNNQGYIGGIPFGSVFPPTNGAADVSVQGPIFTQSSTANGGSVQVQAGGKVSLMNGITTSGLLQSGLVSLTSEKSAVSVIGSINTSALPLVASLDNYNGGSGGIVDLQAANSIAVLGSIITSGALCINPGFGGYGGQVIMRTGLSATPEQRLYSGNVSVAGYIQTTGGMSSFLTQLGYGGGGGNVDIRTGTLQVFGAAGGASINTSGGAAYMKGPSGLVIIETSAIQNLPGNFNLKSSVASEYALPGGLFTIGGPVINGTAGAIVTASAYGSGYAEINRPFFGESLTITTKGYTSITLADLNKTVQTSSGATRVRVTPAEAVALYQLSHGQPQTIGLNKAGQATSLNPQSNGISEIKVPVGDLPASFSAFVLATADNSSQVALTLDGENSVLNLSSTPVREIRGQLIFSSGGTGASLQFGTAPLVVLSGGSVRADGVLRLVGGSITNSGTISAGQQIVLVGSALNVLNTATGVIDAPFLTLPVSALPSSFIFNNARGDLRSTVISVQPSPLQTSSDTATVSLRPTASTWIFSSSSQTGVPQSINLQGSIGEGVLSSLTLVTTANSGAAGLVGTNIRFLPGTNINVSQSLILMPSGTISLEGASLGGNVVVVSGYGLVSENSTISAKQLLSITGSNPIGGSTLEFGTATALSGATVQIVSIGSVGLTGTSIGTYTASGALRIISVGGAIRDLGGSFLTSSNSLSLQGRGIEIGASSGSTLNAGKSINITDLGAGVAIKNNTGVAVGSGRLLVSTPGLLTIESDLSAGSLAGAATGKLINSDIAAAGDIVLLAKNISIGSNSSMIANGTTLLPGNIRVTAIGGAITMGTNNQFTANGGNVSILASNAVSGASGNSFNAFGVALSASLAFVNTGGVVEIGAGGLAPMAGIAVLKPSGTVSPSVSALGTAVVINNNGNQSGVVQANLTAGGQINLSATTAPSVVNPATLNLTGGAIVIDASGPSNSVKFDGATFTVSAYKPVAFVESAAALPASKQAVHIANVFPASGSAAGRLAFDDSGKTAGKSAVIDSIDGQVFMETATDVQIYCSQAQLRLRKGSLVKIDRTDGQLRVLCLSGPGDVCVLISGTEFRLSPGEELSLSADPLDLGQLIRGDKIARRNLQCKAIGNGYVALCDVSLVSAMLNSPHLRHFIDPVGKIERRVSRKLYKTAAALEQATKARGNYQSL